MTGATPQVTPARTLAMHVLGALDAGAPWERAWPQTVAVGVDARERRLAHDLASGTVRLRARLDAIAARYSSRPPEMLDPVVRRILRLGLYQLFEMNGVAPHAAVHETVELAKLHAPAAAGFVNAVLRAALRAPDGSAIPERATLAATLAARQSHPEWLVARWLERFGRDETEALCAYGNRRPELCLRVNALRTTRAGLLAQLPHAQAGVWSPESVRLARAGYGAARAAVESGIASVQDEAATLVAPIVVAAGATLVLDVAAAPGGKACHLGELLAPEGAVHAFDRRADKLERIRDNARRLGLTNVVATVADLRHLRVAPAPAVLLDAPCSGLGVLARRPDLRWRKDAADLLRLQALQLELLMAAAQLVEPGGRLVYSVCSFEPEETTDVVARFAATPGFEPDDAGIPERLQAGPGILYSLPQRHGIDGGFVACWRRKAGR